MPAIGTFFLLLSAIAAMVHVRSVAASELQPKVAAILHELNMTGEYAAAFSENDIDYAAFLGLNNELLKDLGVHTVGARAKLLREVETAKTNVTSEQRIILIQDVEELVNAHVTAQTKQLAEELFSRVVKFVDRRDRDLRTEFTADGQAHSTSIPTMHDRRLAAQQRDDSCVTDFQVQQSSATDWTAIFANDAGKGVQIRTGGTGGEGADSVSAAGVPALQVTDAGDRVRFQVNSDGNVGIGGSPDPQARLHVNGNVNTTGDLYVGGTIKATSFCIGDNCITEWPLPPTRLPTQLPTTGAPTPAVVGEAISLGTLTADGLYLGALEIRGDAEFENIAPLLRYITHVVGGEYGGLSIRSMTDATAHLWSAFDGLVRVTGPFSIRRNTVSVISGFNALKSVSDDLWIGDNDVVTEINGFNSLEVIEGGLTIQYGNKKLASVTGFQKLKEMQQLGISGTLMTCSSFPADIFCAAAAAAHARDGYAIYVSRQFPGPGCCCDSCKLNG